jgi:F420 biosynthesis protein FbiB-like protein
MAERLEVELARDGIGRDEIERQTKRSRARIQNAPLVILCSLVTEGLVPQRDERREALEWQMAVQSVGAVLQTLFLAASERGIGSCWMAAPMYCPEAVREAMALPPVCVPQALALMGYPSDWGKIRDRKPFHQVVEFR